MSFHCILLQAKVVLIFWAALPKRENKKLEVKNGCYINDYGSM